MTNISTNELESGIKLCLANALRLEEDSMLLASQGRYPSAYNSLQISLEEYGKALAITLPWAFKAAGINLLPDMILKEVAKMFNKHVPKTQVTVVLELFTPRFLVKARNVIYEAAYRAEEQGKEELDESEYEEICGGLWKEIIDELDYSKKRANAKNIATYVDNSGGLFVSPEQLVDRDTFEQFRIVYARRKKAAAFLFDNLFSSKGKEVISNMREQFRKPPLSTLNMLNT